MIHASRYSRHSPADRAGRLYLYRCMQCGELTCFSKEVRQAPAFWCHPEQVKPWSNQMHWAYEAVIWLMTGGYDGVTDFDDMLGTSIDDMLRTLPLSILRDVPNVDDKSVYPNRKELKEALRLARLWGDVRKPASNELPGWVKGARK